MKREQVDSTSLSAIGYDENERVLEVEFENGGLYAYENVPKDVYEGLRAAASKGRYFLANIRNEYRSRRVR